MTQTISPKEIRTASSKKSQILILLGAPGSGKGTQASLLKEKLQIPHISTGDLLRSHIQRQTQIGVAAKEFIEQGRLVPDKMVLEMLFDRFSKEDCKKGAILDGFPRTIQQAEQLELYSQSSFELCIIQLHIDPSILQKRIEGRLSCCGCGRSFHITQLPSDQRSVCPSCGATLQKRADDTIQTLSKRLHTYFEQTEPLISFYRKRDSHRLHTIDGQLPIDSVFQQIMQILESDS